MGRVTAFIAPLLAFTLLVSTAQPTRASNLTADEKANEAIFDIYAGYAEQSLLNPEADAALSRAKTVWTFLKEHGLSDRLRPLGHRSFACFFANDQSECKSLFPSSSLRQR